jgi:prepilin peptidase CpaA
MIGNALQAVCLALLLAMLVAAAVSDLRQRRIPDTLCLWLALPVMPYGIAAGWHLADYAAHLGSGLALGGLAYTAFGLRLLGGGDVKMMTALGLWLSPSAAIDTLVLATLAGAVLGVMIARRYRHRLSRPSVPYGMAIAFAGATQVIAPLARLLH